MTAFQDIFAIGPVAIVSAAALLVLVVEALNDRSESWTSWITIAGLVAAGVTAFLQGPAAGTAFSGMVARGGLPAFFGMLFCGSGLLSVMLSRSYIAKENIEHGEFYALVLFAVAGMMLMAAAADLVILFLGLELMSICFYVLAGFARRRRTSNEAALKYFLLGAFATGFLLYGIALVYGATGTTGMAGIAAHVAAGSPGPTLVIGLGLLLIGLGFKVAAVPFHMWVPDVYEGAPTTVTAFMSTGGKAAAFAAMLLVFTPALVHAVPAVRDVLAVLAGASMIVGNVIAVSQVSVKRMLAYSSIAHAGYILTGLVAGNAMGNDGVVFYLAAYIVMNVGAFGVLALLESPDGQHLTFDDYAGLPGRHPVLAALMALFLFSLTGIPPFAGFFGKYYVFAGAIEAGYTWLAILGVLMSVMSAYYYLRLVVLMYFKDQVSAMEPVSPGLGTAALILCALAVLQFGIFPSTLLNLF
jgi:NADH-quinone oxidoreductase subunit N